MSTMLTFEKWQTDYLDFVKRVEEPVVRFTGRMAGSAAPYVPAKPAAMKSLPTMTEVVDSGLKFRRRMVDQNAQFVHHMMKALRPMTEKFEAARVETHAPKPHVAHKPSARTAPRRMTKVA
jgi:hypothetical protein